MVLCMIERRAISDLRVAVTSRGDTPQAEVYEQFGRTYWLMIYSQAEDQWYAIDNNSNRARPNGAGLATAQVVLEMGVSIVITGETGPKAFRALTSGGVAVVHNVNGVVEDALREWLSGKLTHARLANDPGSPNCLLGRNGVH